MFNMTFPSNNIVGQKAGPTIAKSDGWYILFGTVISWNS